MKVERIIESVLKKQEVFSKPIMITVEGMEKICPECAEQMRKKGIRKIDARFLFSDRWETLPRGWTRKSLESFWKSMGGSESACREKAKEFTDDPDAFCAALKDRIMGTTYWRGPKKKK